MQMLRRSISALLLISLFTCGIRALSGQKRNKLSEGDPIYGAGNGVKVASLVHAVPAVLPDRPELKRSKHISALMIVVGADGKIEHVLEANKVTSPFDHAAEIATEQSQFEPGSLDGKPVSTRLLILVPFLGDGTPAVPIAAAFGQKTGTLRSLRPPVPINQPEAEFSEEARRTHTEGTVKIQSLIDEDGVPRPIALLTAAGKGLDEKALDAVSRYKFKPATFEGVPVASLVNIEINFRFRPTF